MKTRVENLIMKYKHKKNILIRTLGLMVSVVTLFISACSSPDEQTVSTVSTAEQDPARYQTAPVQRINPTYELSLPAELKPYEQVAVHAKVTGFVKKIYVDRGDRVRQGQLLALLEAPEMEQHYLSQKSIEQQAQSDYVYAKQAYDRLLSASKTIGAVADLELDRAKSAMESAQAMLESSKAGTTHSSQLQQYLRITAPFDGIITERSISVGALAGAGQQTPLFMMAQSHQLRLTLLLPEKHASSVHPEMTASFTVNSQPGKVFEAQLSRTSGLLDQTNRSLTLEFDIKNPNQALHGGDYAQVKLKLKRKQPSYWVQNQSVLRTQSGTFVMTVNQNEVKRIPVLEGVRLDSLTEVFGPLSPEDAILIKPSEEIKDGKLK